MNKYILVSSSNPDKLIERVEERMNEGWLCAGGVTSHTTPPKKHGNDVIYPDYSVLVQAMHKIEPIDL